MKLSECIKLFNSVLGSSVLTLSNVDDLFREIYKSGIKEVIVNREDMSIIVRFYLYNVGNDKNGNQGKILKEGKIDKFFGIKLIYEDS